MDLAFSIKLHFLLATVLAFWVGLCLLLIGLAYWFARPALPRHTLLADAGIPVGESLAAGRLALISIAPTALLGALWFTLDDRTSSVALLGAVVLLLALMTCLVYGLRRGVLDADFGQRDDQ